MYTERPQMCGIFGWIKPKGTNTDLDFTKAFVKGLLQTQSRGEDATGYYSLGTGIVKEAITAKDFINKSMVEDLNKENFVIGHCRAASGNSIANLKDSKNAHPFESKNWVLVHNGVVNMDPIKNYPYTSNVDSESILAYIEKTSLKNAISSIKGSAALVLYAKHQKKLYFWTDGNRPLSLAFYHDIIFFASTKVILKKALEVKNDFGIFPKISYATMYECELLEFDLIKNKFTQKGIIEPKKDIPKEDDDFNNVPDSWKSNYGTRYVNGQQIPLGITHNYSKPTLQRGCTTNPNDHKVVRIGFNKN
jgi:asparagine synthetase B (glutamine-hydrolysing)